MKNAKSQSNYIINSSKKELSQTPQQRFNSVIASAAHIGTLCENDRTRDQVTKAISTVITGNKETPLILSAICELLFVHGLRISEALNIKGSDISPKGHIKIKGLKKSKDRIISVGLHKSFWLSMRNITQKIGDVYSRFYFYREFKKRGIRLEFNGYKNAAVTHAPRHLLIKELSILDKDLTLVQSTLGHKSIKSTQHYDKKSKQNRT